MAQSIQRQLEEIEVKQKELEDQGVRLERTLRGEEGGDFLPITFPSFDRINSRVFKNF